MAYLMTLLYVGGMLNVPIPRRLVRQLGWAKRQRVYVEENGDTALTVTPQDDFRKQRAPRRRRPAR